MIPHRLWLLLLPRVGLLWVPFYNFHDPTLFGFPFFYHVESEAFGHLGRDCGRDGKHHTAHDRVDQNRPVMGECGGNAGLDVGGIF
jgi:hypothetical protein